MAGFSTTIVPSQLNDWTMHAVQKIGKTLTDVITPAHTIFKKMESSGRILTDEPGQGPVEDILYANADRTIHLSRSVTQGNRDYTPVQGLARAQFDWILDLQTLTIPMYDYLNLVDEVAGLNFVRSRMKMLDLGQEENLVNYMWNGLTSGSESVFGIKDIIRFDPTTDGSKGAVGRIPATAPTTGLPAWRNQALDFNAEYKKTTNGKIQSTFLDEANGLSDLLTACSNNGAGMRPDLIPCNQAAYRMFYNLFRCGLVFRDDNAMKELGTPGFEFEGATVYHDRDFPTDATYIDTGEGALMAITTKTLSWKWARGLRKQWGEMRTLDNPTAYGWDRTSQFSMTVNDRRKNGVLFGLKQHTPTVD